MKILLTVITALALLSSNEDKAALCDSLQTWLEQRSGVRAEIKLKAVLCRSGEYDFYFSREMSSWRWKDSDIKWLRDTLSEKLSCNSRKIGHIFSGGTALEDLKTPELVFNGKTQPFKYRSTPKSQKPFITQSGNRTPSKGLYGRHIALWHSHGRYWEDKEDRWKWQRAPLHRTVEDIYTQSYVLQFLIPMLENAGAMTFTPRERDHQCDEVICDADASFADSLITTPGVRRKGQVNQGGAWEDAGSGFADAKMVYSSYDNPFSMGRSSKARCTPQKNGSAITQWSAAFPERGRYAVYISYPPLQNASSCARYTVEHLGGSSEFIVNQKICAGSWVYLGSFEFEGKGSVTLDNSTPEGYAYVKGSYVGADAVRFGGGMGKIGRGPLAITSGLPCYAEGAIYNMQWCGFGKEIWDNWDGDYTDDYASRGLWVSKLSEMGVPVDLSLAFHTDAGMAGRDSTIGTLAIYSSKTDGQCKLSDGTNRLVCRTYADFVQSQLIRDIRAQFCPDWRRRELRDAGYSEARKGDVPALLLELLSHQNYADMKLGADPAFRFCACRAVYKGILKFLSLRYGKDYVVQPLPVRDFSSEFTSNGRLLLQWSPQPDTLETTATPKGYILYTRVDSGAFDSGKVLPDTSTVINLKKGHIYSFKVEAFNDGGRSFPSEILSAGIPENAAAGQVAVINCFEGVRAPYGFSDEHWAGFNAREDSGVQYIEDYSYIGENYNFDRSSLWFNDDDAGFGASQCTFYPGRIAGNNFDYPSIHGKAIFDSGYSFCSMSAGAFCKKGSTAKLIDLICGKQTELWNTELKAAVTSSGASILISGSHIAEDCSSSFCRDSLGFFLASSHAGSGGSVADSLEFHKEFNPYCYCIERADAIQPAGQDGTIVLKYSDSHLPAAVRTICSGRKVAAFGFPLETIKRREKMNSLIADALDFLKYE